MKKIVLSTELNPDYIVKIIGIVLGFIFVLSAIGLYLRYSSYQSDMFGFAPKLDMDKENTIPTYISSVNLLIAATILSFIAMIKRKRADAQWKQWGILGFIFFFLSLDESASLHEGVSRRFDWMAGGFSGITHYAWGILGTGLILGFLFYFRKFIFSLPAVSRNRFILSGALFLSGALGVEAFGGYLFSQVGYEDVIYQVCAMAEEVLEMLGIYFFIWSLFRYIDENLATQKVAIPEQAILRIKPEEERIEVFHELAQERA